MRQVRKKRMKSADYMNESQIDQELAELADAFTREDELFVFRLPVLFGEFNLFIGTFEECQDFANKLQTANQAIQQIVKCDPIWYAIESNDYQQTSMSRDPKGIMWPTTWTKDIPEA